MQCDKCKKCVGWTYDVNIYPLNMMSVCLDCRRKLIELIDSWIKEANKHV